MKSFFIVGAVLVLFVLPLSALASNHFTSDSFSLVPEVVRNAPNPQAIQACHLVTLVDNIVSFATYVAVFIATVMFAYAGFLYVTAASRPDNLNQAKGIFGKVFLGLLLVLGAWLIINLVMSVLFNEEIGGSWTSIDCVAVRDIPTQPDPRETGPIPSPRVPDGPDAEREQAVRVILNSCGLCINDQECDTRDGNGDTEVGNFNEATTQYACELRRLCDGLVEGDCELVVTGGSELRYHDGGTRSGSHGGGDKFDLRVTERLEEYIEVNENAGIFERIDPPRFGTDQWYETTTGAVWTRENDPLHYDICVSNCGAPAAQGS